MFTINNLYFLIEILVAEMIFLFSCPKRKLFALRFVGAAAICLVLGYFFPMPAEIKYDSWFSLLRFAVLFGYTVGVMAFSFKLKVPALVSSCVAGYAVQHIAYRIMTAFAHYVPIFADAGAYRSELCELVIFPFVYVAMFFAFGWSAAKNETYKHNDWRLIVVSVVTIVICVGLTRFSRKTSFDISNVLYSVTCCLLALFIQYNLYRMFELKNENVTMRRIWEEEKKQYEISKNTIDLVNIKYHDIKHKLNSLHGLSKEEADSLRETLRLYDSGFRTGNEVLDVILTENSLRNREDGVEFTFMGNGADLSFMSVTDIYSLFGNALENAVEAVRKLDEPEKKTVGITMEAKGDMFAVNFTNYFAGKAPEFKNGLPMTTKETDEGYHGFGMKSIKLISEKYHGNMRASVENDLFTLNVYLMR